MRPYSSRGRRYVLPMWEPFCRTTRPTRTAAGMEYTRRRCRQVLSNDGNRLAAWGTCDPLARGLAMHTEFNLPLSYYRPVKQNEPIPERKLVLSDLGRIRLQSARRRARHG